MTTNIRDKAKSFFGPKQSSAKKAKKPQESRIASAENQLETQQNKAQSGVHSGLFEKLEGYFNGSLEHRFPNLESLVAHFDKTEKGAYHYPTGDILAAFGQLCERKLGTKSVDAEKLHEALQGKDGRSSVSAALTEFAGASPGTPRFMRLAALTEVLANRWDHSANGGHGEWRARPPVDRMEGAAATAQSYHAIQHERSPRKQLAAGIKNTWNAVTQGTGALAKSATRPLKTGVKTTGLQASLPIMRGAQATQEATVSAAKATQKKTKAAATAVVQKGTEVAKAAQTHAKKSAAWVNESAVHARKAGETGARNVAHAVVQATPVARTRLQETEARVAQLEKQVDALTSQVVEAGGDLLKSPISRDTATWSAKLQQNINRTGRNKDK